MYMCPDKNQYIDYDKSKTRVENYKALRNLLDKYISIKEESSFGRHCDYCIKHRQFKGMHLDWNYTEKLNDLIEQGVVKVPITDFDVIFVEWSAGNLDEVELTYKYEKALFDWDGKEWPGCEKEGRSGFSLFWERYIDLEETHLYNDSNREEYLQFPTFNTVIMRTQSLSRCKNGNTLLFGLRVLLNKTEGACHIREQI